MRAEIISTGDEIVSGSITDTNASWLAAELLDAGIVTGRISCTGDEAETLAAVIGEAAHRADLVLVTGGLGPTEDDRTARAAALAAQDRLGLNREALVFVETYFEKRKVTMPEINRKQAELPLTAGVVENLFGTAPGFSMVINQALFFFMPGVPMEMKKMFKNGVLPEINRRFKLDTRVLSRCFSLFGLPEAEVGTRLAGFRDQFPDMRLGFRADFPLIYVKFSCPGSRLSGPALEEEMERAGQWIASRLEKRIVSFLGLTMEEEVGRLLTACGATVAVAESCTGGLVADMLTDVAGSSDYFLLSAVTYANQAKIGVLGVYSKTIEKNGAVHEETARSMAEGARKAAGADYAIATSGVAGPGGGSEEKPVGMVCIGLAGPGFSRGKTCHFSFKERRMNKKIFAVKALELLRRELDAKK
ncbi:MAG: CinA family nicotinamide mononucleotide deamidase-related protein [Desulfobacteraceae bacterium]